MYYTTTYQSPLGELTLACDGEHLVGLWLAGQKHYGGGIAGELEEKDGLPVLEEAKGWLSRYFAGERPDAGKLPLRPMGGAFRQVVWGLLQEIPYGQVVTYGQLARQAAAKLGRPTMASRAVGGAVGHNPISIIIPCHRVVGTNGSLTGYAGGVQAKIRLLRLEGADLSGLSIPTVGTAL